MVQGSLLPSEEEGGVARVGVHRLPPVSGGDGGYGGYGVGGGGGVAKGVGGGR